MTIYTTIVEISRCENCKQFGVAIARDQFQSKAIATCDCKGAATILASLRGVIDVDDVREFATGILARSTTRPEAMLDLWFTRWTEACEERDLLRRLVQDIQNSGYLKQGDPVDQSGLTQRVAAALETVPESPRLPST